jgi:HTH-type transcriptional regulator/antitoxin HigA
MTTAQKRFAQAWEVLEPALRVTDEGEYRKAAERLNVLLDEVGNDAWHPLLGLVNVLGTLVHAYEEEHHALPEGTAADALRSLLREHGLRQEDLPEVGSRGVVSQILAGSREPTLRQIKMLGKRFGVSPAVFVDLEES